jgi:hypothetical protein
MSKKSFIPEQFRNEVKKQLDQVEVFKATMSEEEISKKMPEFTKHYKEHKDTDKFYNDGFCDWVLVQSPEPELTQEDIEKKSAGEKVLPRNAPEKKESQFTEDNWLFKCKFKLGQISIFGTREQIQSIGFNNVRIVRGKLGRQYTMRGTSGFYKSLGDMAKAFGKKVDELNETDYKIWHSLNVYQVIS